MSKLFKLKTYVSLPNAARYLSEVCNEEIAVADILGLALERKIVLSIDIFNGAPGRLYKWIEVNPTENDMLGRASPETTIEFELTADCVKYRTLTQLRQGSVFVRGVFELDQLISDNESFIRNVLSDEIGAPRITRFVPRPIYVSYPDNTLCEIEWNHMGPIKEASQNDSIHTLEGIQQHKEWSQGILNSNDFQLTIKISELHNLIGKLSDPKVTAPEQSNGTFYFDPDDDDYPELLHVAFRAWEHARNAGDGTPKQRIQSFLEARYPHIPTASRNAIALVANWNKVGGRPAK